ncbi:hypothetical protein MVEN_01890100 [Mycena venus]|uniref:Uncharacterized protein n=1 Tax=Mycena venus TaxID=2733690 RepID=A0A8H6XJ98_9AGAR|nr:hypothetical protein MVEN_01890100 [Mycena venus]
MASTVAGPLTDSPEAAFSRVLPIVNFTASLIISSALGLVRAVIGAVSFAGKIIAHPIVFLSPFPVLLYILAPVIVFIQIFLEIFVYTPSRAIIYLSDAFYPAYVFLGVACITGGLLGLVGRLTVNGVVYIITPPPSALPSETEEEKPLRIR